MGLTGPEKTDPSKYNDARFGGLLLYKGDNIHIWILYIGKYTFL